MVTIEEQCIAVNTRRKYTCQVSRLRIENLDLTPTDACVTICHAWWKSLGHYSIN